MKEKIKAHYLKFGPRRFVAATVIILFIVDLINSYFLKLYWIKKDLSQTMVVESLRRSQLRIEDFSSETLLEMTGFVNNSFYFFLLLILANNLFFYLFYLRKKLWAQGYVLFYTITGAILSVTFLVDDPGLGMNWLAYNAFTVPLYLYFYTGVKMLKAETTLAPKKKGR